MTTACDIVNTLRFHFCTFFHTFSYDFDEFFFIADSAYCTAFAYMFNFTKNFSVRSRWTPFLLCQTVTRPDVTLHHCVEIEGAELSAQRHIVLMPDKF